MDYKAFFADIEAWIAQANRTAMRLGMASPDFWQWVADSAGEMCRKYQGSRLAIKQMDMLVEWLEEAFEKQKGARKDG